MDSSMEKRARNEDFPNQNVLNHLEGISEGILSGDPFLHSDDFSQIFNEENLTDLLDLNLEKMNEEMKNELFRMFSNSIVSYLFGMKEIFEHLPLYTEFDIRAKVSSLILEFKCSVNPISILLYRCKKFSEEKILNYTPDISRSDKKALCDKEIKEGKEIFFQKIKLADLLYYIYPKEYQFYRAEDGQMKLKNISTDKKRKLSEWISVEEKKAEIKIPYYMPKDDRITSLKQKYASLFSHFMYL